MIADLIKNDESLTIKLEGRLDTPASQELEKTLDGKLEGIKELIFDLEGLDYMSSAGLRILLSAQKKMNGQGSMKVVHVCDLIMDIFEVTGFSSFLTIE
ncbi:MAG: STAS domain-containing protein [Firmicutes bacterium]|nr:STAS domain-containing protein [Bacillota bacterium]